MSPSSVVFSAIMAVFAVGLSIAATRQYTDLLPAPQESASDTPVAMSAEEFARSESLVWPPGAQSDGAPSGLPEGWTSVTEVGLDIPMPEGWVENRGEDSEPLPETDGDGEFVGGNARIIEVADDGLDASGTVIRLLNNLAYTGKVESAINRYERPAPGIHEGTAAEVTYEVLAPDLKDEADGPVRGVLYAVQPTPEDEPVAIWWEWPEEDYPDNVVDIVTVGVRPAV
ncbi:hypothetical protein [Nocardiopsis chromatogenes]|uniref:hypothetical protein n=1 Tax=Nocardiopsis chromatogenes TaxID=280239 RepID=UPI001268552F|nr:hypothetical protein [Nocardiopsis chromatogenes]